MRHKQSIAGVDGFGIGARLARLAIDRREHDLAIQPLERPSVRDEAGGEIVQQFRMRGLLALHSEIAGGGHQRLAEMPAPDAIHDHARRQRGAIAENIVGQFAASRSLDGTCCRPSKARSENGAARSHPAT
jgi:hypothetical protein